MKLYLQLISLVAMYTSLTGNDFLNVPQPVTSLEYEQLKRLKLDQGTCFTWDGPSFKLTISYQAQQTYITLLADETTINQLPKDIQAQFTKTIGDNVEPKLNFTYIWGVEPNKKTAITEDDVPSSYSVGAHYRTVAEPQTITVEQLAKLITENRVLFYTGAGISASIIPDMKTLEEMIGFIQDRRRLDSIKTIVNIVSMPQATAANFASFICSTVEASPTPAHRVLSSLCTYAKTSVLSENIDLLQEAAGIKPLFAGNKSTHNLCTAENLKQIDLLICIGLSHDDRGFIGQYKQHNQQGRIVALDFKAPDYLDNQDMLLQGDIQQNLPLVWDSIKNLRY